MLKYFNMPQIILNAIVTMVLLWHWTPQLNHTYQNARNTIVYQLEQTIKSCQSELVCDDAKLKKTVGIYKAVIAIK